MPSSPTYPSSPRMRWSPPEQNASGPSPVSTIDADVTVVAGALERVLELEEGLGPEGVAHLGPADGDLGDPLGGLVADVAVAGVDDLPVGARAVMTVSMGVSTLGAITPTNVVTVAVDTPGPPCEGVHKW